VVCGWTAAVVNVTGSLRLEIPEGVARSCGVCEIEQATSSVSLAPSLRLGHLGPKSWDAPFKTGRAGCFRPGPTSRGGPQRDRKNDPGPALETRKGEPRGTATHVTSYKTLIHLPVCRFRKSNHRPILVALRSGDPKYCGTRGTST
jgi:hypothetical protein